jgi:Rrf2 family transcriptional regulator, cysteine metabolism repressor
MKITFKCDYALKAVLDLALHHNKELVRSHDLAKRIDAPSKFLEQVLLELKKGGFVESRRGKMGGYMLSKTPGQITVGDVIKFIEGPIEPISCINEEYFKCADLNSCVFKQLWQRVFQATSDIIDNITFDKLVAQVNTDPQVLTYSI